MTKTEREEVRGINSLLVEFHSGHRALLKSDDEHEWVVSCVPRIQIGEVWANGVLEEIRNYVMSYLTLYGAMHGSNPADLEALLSTQLDAVQEYIKENQSLIEFVEKEGWHDALPN